MAFFARDAPRGRTRLASMRRLAVAALLALGGCGSCASEPPAPAADAAPATAESAPAATDAPTRAPWPASFAPTDDLWRRAPPGATVGLVVADGAVGPLIDGLDHVRRVMEPFEPSRALLTRWRNASVDLLGLDAFDAPGLAAAGIDRARGAALFFGADASVELTILPVGDRGAFVRAAGGRPSEGGAAAAPGDSGVEDRVGGRRCRVVDGRYACARRGAGLGAVGDGGRLGQRALAQPHRGPLEVVGDGRRTSAVGRALRELGLPYARAGWFELAVDLAPGRGEARGFIEGRPVSRLAVDVAGRSAAEGLTPGAAGAARIVMSPGALVDYIGVDGEPLRVGSRDLRREFFDQLDGEVEVTARGDGVFAGELRAHLRDPARAARALPTVCKTLAAAWKARLYHPENGRCKGALDVATLPYGAVLPAYWATERVKLLVDVDRERSQLLVRFAESSDPRPSPADVGPSVGWLADAGWHWVLWGRSFDPLATLGAENRERVAGHLQAAQTPAERERFAAVRWMLGHVAEMGLAARVQRADKVGEGVAFRLLFDSFAGDGPTVFARYRRALEASVAGDLATYRRELAALADEAPESRAAIQWRLVESEAPPVALSYLVSSFFFSKSPKVPRLWDVPPPM